MRRDYSPGEEEPDNGVEDMFEVWTIRPVVLAVARSLGDGLAGLFEIFVAFSRTIAVERGGLGDNVLLRGIFDVLLRLSRVICGRHWRWELWCFLHCLLDCSRKLRGGTERIGKRLFKVEVEQKEEKSANLSAVGVRDRS